jgi:hypothetical protein
MMINDKFEINDIIGLKIIKCYRFFYEAFSDNMPEHLRDQETDGSLYLLFSNNMLIEFKPISEEFSIDIKRLNHDYSLNNHDIKDVSSNDFWMRFLDRKISFLKLLKNGIQINFENLKKIEIIYLSETKYTFDSLIIREPDVVDMR